MNLQIYPKFLEQSSVVDPVSKMYPDSMGSLDSDSQSGSRYRSSKMAQKSRKPSINFIFWSADCSLLRTEGFSCSLDVLYRGLVIIKLQFLIKNRNKILSCIFFSIFGHQNLGSGSWSGLTWNAGFRSVPGFIPWIQIHNTGAKYLWKCRNYSLIFTRTGKGLLELLLDSSHIIVIVYLVKSMAKLNVMLQIYKPGGWQGCRA